MRKYKVFVKDKDGQQISLADYCRKYGFEYDKVHHRIKRGWDIERAIIPDKQIQNKIKDGSKICSSCKINKPISEYHFRKGRKSKIQAECRACALDRTQTFVDTIRMQIVNHYSQGNGCAICGEKRLQVLDIDHINNDGFQERVKTKGCQGTWRRIINSGFPEGYRILCRNCNWVEYLRKSKRGIFREKGHVANIVPTTSQAQTLD